MQIFPIRNPRRKPSERSVAASIVVVTALVGAMEGQPAATGSATGDVVFTLSTGSVESAAMRRSALQNTVALHPEDALAWGQLGLLEGQLQNYEAAEQDLRRSVALDPAAPETHYLLGLALVANPRAKLDWPDAIGEFRKALDLRPSYADAFTYLGVGLSATGKNDEAVEALEHAVRLAPESSSAQFNLALALEALGRNAEAAAAYRAAIANRPGFAEAHSALGKLLFRGSDREGAAKELREAIAANPDLQDAHYALGQVLRAQGHGAESTREVEIALALGSREPDGITSSQLSNAAMKEAAAGNRGEAETLLRKAIALRPDYGVPHYNLGLILADDRSWDAAISQLSQAASLMPAQAGPWFSLGRVLRHQGRGAEALTCLRWAAAMEPSRRIMDELRQTAADLKQPVQTAATQPAFGVRGETARAFQAYAMELGAQNDQQGAIGMLLHTLALSPAAAGPRLALAAAYRRSGNDRRAMQEYRKVLAVDPQNGEALGALLPVSAVAPQR